MAKEVFGEYAIFDSGNGVRFQQNNKLVSEKALPPEVVAYLRSKLATAGLASPDPEPTTAGFAKPTPEQLAAMREESLKPAPGLELTPEEEAQRAVAPPAEPIEGYTREELADMRAASFPDEPLSPADFDEGMSVDERDKIAEDNRAARAPEPAVDTEFMERTSIYTADLKDIAQALYDRFGIYTIWLAATPQTDEVNPLTGEAFTRYHQGIAYQALIRARGNGFFNRNPERSMENMTEGRIAHENYQATTATRGDVEPTAPTQAAPGFAERTAPNFHQRQTHYIAHEPDPVTGELRAVQRPVPQAANYASGSSARQRYDATEDEIIAEPRIGQQVIRPDW